MNSNNNGVIQEMVELRFKVGIGHRCSESVNHTCKKQHHLVRPTSFWSPNILIIFHELSEQLKFDDISLSNLRIMKNEVNLFLARSDQRHIDFLNILSL